VPIFEFQCPECKVTTEKLLSKSEDRDKTRTNCPKCRVKMEPVAYSKVAPFRWGKGGSWNG
jgi:putative FmdB family regulatory protein